MLSSGFSGLGTRLLSSPVQFSVCVCKVVPWDSRLCSGDGGAAGALVAGDGFSGYARAD